MLQLCRSLLSRVRKCKRPSLKWRQQSRSDQLCAPNEDLETPNEPLPPLTFDPHDLSLDSRYVILPYQHLEDANEPPLPLNFELHDGLSPPWATNSTNGLSQWTFENESPFSPVSYEPPAFSPLDVDSQLSTPPALTTPWPPPLEYGDLLEHDDLWNQDDPWGTLESVNFDQMPVLGSSIQMEDLDSDALRSHPDVRLDLTSQLDDTPHVLETETTAQVGLLRPQDVPHGHFTQTSLATPSFASTWDELDSQWFVQWGRIDFLRFQVQSLVASKSRCWDLLKTMGPAYLRFLQSGNAQDFDRLWRKEFLNFWSLQDRNRARVFSTRSRSGLICLLFKLAEKIHKEIESNRLLLSQSQEELDAMAKEAKRRRRENMRERADALRKVGRDERKSKQRYWHSTLLETPSRKRERELRALTNKVLADLAATWPRFLEERSAKLPPRTHLQPLPMRTTHHTADPPSSMTPMSSCHIYSILRIEEFRLLEVRYNPELATVETALHVMPMHACPPYLAVSYTWGDPDRCKSIKVNGKIVEVRENIFSFLSSFQSSAISEQRYLWIDALCIDQNNIRERNHQVKLMKEIYQQASNVVVWLGKEADDSDTAMDYFNSPALGFPKPKSNNHGRLWTIDQGKAILALCERIYWRRIWVIQEIIHARDITVCCGQKNFPWQALEKTYNTLKAIESEGRQRHYRYAAQVLDSVACTMVWQRAHWRHPDTPAPAMVQLVRVFRDWQAGDIRDKVNALNGLVSPETNIVIEYQSTTQQVFEAVRKAATEWTERDDALLREVLGLPYPYFRRERRAPLMW